MQVLFLCGAASWCQFEEGMNERSKFGIDCNVKWNILRFKKKYSFTGYGHCTYAHHELFLIGGNDLLFCSVSGDDTPRKRILRSSDDEELLNHLQVRLLCGIGGGEDDSVVIFLGAHFLWLPSWHGFGSAFGRVCTYWSFMPVDKVLSSLPSFILGDFEFKFPKSHFLAMWKWFHHINNVPWVGFWRDGRWYWRSSFWLPW